MIPLDAGQNENPDVNEGHVDIVIGAPGVVGGVEHRDDGGDDGGDDDGDEDGDTSNDEDDDEEEEGADREYSFSGARVLGTAGELHQRMSQASEMHSENCYGALQQIQPKVHGKCQNDLGPHSWGTGYIYFDAAGCKKLPPVEQHDQRLSQVNKSDHSHALLNLPHGGTFLRAMFGF